MSRKAIITVTNDLISDQRAHKVAETLLSYGYKVLLVGRKITNNNSPSRNYETKRFSLLFNRGFLFYANYNIRLFFFLLFRRYDLIWAVDLDSLLPGYLLSRLKKKKLIYDAHELFTEVPELAERPLVKGVWTKIEQRILPKLKHVVTVSELIANHFSKKYNINALVLRNFPFVQQEQTVYTPERKTIIYQGSINKNRGLEELVMAMINLEDTSLIIVGDGDEFENIRELIKKNKLIDSIQLIGRVPFEDLPDWTRKGTLGVSIEKAEGSMSYAYALPNKVFDYIKFGVPVLVSSELTELAELVNHYKIGETVSPISSEALAESISNLFNDPSKLMDYSNNCLLAHEDLNWEKEVEKIKALII